VARIVAPEGHREQGFTLMEVIVALTVLAMSILFITRAFLTLLQVTNEGGNITVASSLAVRTLEQVRSGPESQSSTGGWTAQFDAITNQGPIAFPPPHDRYAYEVRVDEIALSPSSAAPAWLTGSPVHSNTLKWITVRVTFNGQVLAQVSSALIRDMYRRP
jgi:prepilin-type N-terminal cleavage/methylation domain-containing protein